MRVYIKIITKGIECKIEWAKNMYICQNIEIYPKCWDPTSQLNKLPWTNSTVQANSHDNSLKSSKADHENAPWPWSDGKMEGPLATTWREQNEDGGMQRSGMPYLGCLLSLPNWEKVTWGDNLEARDWRDRWHKNGMERNACDDVVAILVTCYGSRNKQWERGARRERKGPVCSFHVGVLNIAMHPNLRPGFDFILIQLKGCFYFSF